MAQGKLKVKTKLPGGVKTGKSEGSVKKTAGKVKKGKRIIPSKDPKCIEQEKAKRQFAKQTERNVLRSAADKVQACERVTLQTLKFD